MYRLPTVLMRCRMAGMSSCILPWMTSYKPEELPDWPEIQAVRLLQLRCEQQGFGIFLRCWYNAG